MKILKILFLLLVGVTFALLIGEAGLRLLGYSNPNYYQYDLDLGNALLPGAEGLQQKEGKAYIKINSDGLRDVDHKIKKTDDVLRIAILGDSYAEGMQVPMEQLFWKIFEKKLSECTLAKPNVEVINFGVSGYGTARELLMLKKKVWKYNPDVVLLAFLTGNDVRDNSKALNKVNYVPYFNLENGQLVLDESYRADPSFNLRKGRIAQILYKYINHIRLLQLANDVRHKIKLVLHESQSTGQKPVLEQNELGLDDHIYLPPNTQEWASAWKVTEALIKEMDKEVKNNNAVFMIVTLTNGIQVDPDKNVREAFKRKTGITDLFYPDKRIQSFAKDNGIPVLLLAPKFFEIAEKEQIYFHGFENTARGAGHWNADGHRLAGELISVELCTLLQ